MSSLPFTHREALAGSTHLAAALLADTGGIRAALREAARTACVTSGLPNVPDARLDQVIALAVVTAFGQPPPVPR
ncbi:MAG: hypothetical protein MUF64_11200 [Polyangiaceae bacterium]|jgi:hypothetical protein|nr:hypothetical protein [Polyangiaceae bacterium]